eukprot:scaffold63018_cov16-Tisochrysis_lutea.AAC.1
MGVYAHQALGGGIQQCRATAANSIALSKQEPSQHSRTYAVPVLKLRAPDRHNINPFPSLNTASAVQSQGYTLLPTNPANLQHTLIRAYSRHDISLKKQEPIKCAKDESDVVMRCSEAVFWLHHFSV